LAIALSHEFDVCAFPLAGRCPYVVGRTGVVLQLTLAYKSSHIIE
jgi:hypothetical protein